MKICAWKPNSGDDTDATQASKNPETPLLLRLITVSVSTRLELGCSGKPLIPPSHSPMNVWLMPAGCHGSKIWFFPLMEMTDDNAPGESWLPFRCLHVALIARLMESAWKWGLSIHLVSPERVSRTAELSSPGNRPLRDNPGSALRADAKTYSDGVLTTMVAQTAPHPPPSGTKGYRLMSINIPEPHPYRSPGRWFLWVLWRSSRLCRSSGYRSRHRAASGGNTSSWRTEAECRDGIWNKKQ